MVRSGEVLEVTELIFNYSRMLSLHRLRLTVSEALADFEISEEEMPEVIQVAEWAGVTDEALFEVADGYISPREMSLLDEETLEDEELHLTKEGHGTAVGCLNCLLAKSN